MFLKLKKNRQGSLLLEVLLAIVIMSVSLTAVIRSIVSAAQAASYTKDYTIAMMLVESKMFDVIREASNGFDKQQEGRFEAPFDEYRYFLESKRVTDKNVDDVYEVDLKVVWGPQERSKNVTVKTYLADPPEGQ